MLSHIVVVVFCFLSGIDFRKMYRGCLICSFVICSISLSAQGDFREGYVVKQNGDSISGWVLYRSPKLNYKKCIFKKSRKSAREEFMPDDLGAYGFYEDKRFESKILPLDTQSNNSVFVEVLVKGTASLLFHNDIFYIQKDGVLKALILTEKLIDNESGKFVKKNKEYIGVLNVLFGDCGLSANETKYEEIQLVNLTQNYNRCKGRVGVFYKKELPVTKFGFQVFTGFAISNLAIESLTPTFGASQSALGGFSLDFSAPRINDRLFFTLEGLYSSSIYQNYIETLKSGTTIRIDDVIEISVVKIPLGLKYNLAKDNRAPYFKLGLVQYINLKSQLKTIREVESSGLVTTDIRLEDIGVKNSLGFWGGVGYTFAFNAKFKVFAEARYENVVGFLDETFGRRSELSNVMFLVGLRF